MMKVVGILNTFNLLLNQLSHYSELTGDWTMYLKVSAVLDEFEKSILQED